MGLDERGPDHSTISRTRRLIDVETHREVFAWVLERLAQAGLVKGKTIGVDATTLEANAAMRSIVRRDTGESYEEYLKGLAKASGIKHADAGSPGAAGSAAAEEGLERGLEEPIGSGREDHEDEGRADAPGAQGRARGGPGDGRDRGGDGAGREHRRHGTIMETLAEAEGQLVKLQRRRRSRRWWRACRRSSRTRATTATTCWWALEEVGLRSYVSEPDRGRRRWRDDDVAQRAVYANRRRIRGERGKRLQRSRGERVERSFAHLYETGGMRRTHLRGHANILKRLLIHAGAFNLGRLLRDLRRNRDSAGPAGPLRPSSAPATAPLPPPETRHARAQVYAAAAGPRSPRAAPPFTATPKSAFRHGLLGGARGSVTRR